MRKWPLLAGLGVLFLTLMLCDDASGVGPGTKMGDITLPSDPNAPLTDLQKKKKCLCKIIDEFQTTTARQKKAAAIDKNEKIYLPTWDQYKTHYGLQKAMANRAVTEQATGCVVLPLTHPGGSLFPGTSTGGSETGKKMTTFEEIFHGANHTGPKGWAASLTSALDDFKTGYQAALLSEKLKPEAEQDADLIKDLEDKVKVLCWLGGVFPIYLEVDAKVNVVDVVADTWSTDTAERKLQLADMTHVAETLADNVKQLLDGLESANGKKLCDFATESGASKIFKIQKKTIILQINKGLCAIDEANSSITGCQGTAVDVPTVSQALKDKGVKTK